MAAVTPADPARAFTARCTLGLDDRGCALRLLLTRCCCQDDTDEEGDT